MKLVKLLVLFFLLSPIAVYSQQMPVYSQYMMNRYLINPAVAGSDGFTSVNLTAREQWAGLPGAPSTKAVSFQSRLLKKSYISRNTSIRRSSRGPTRNARVGVGGYIFNDSNGRTSRTGIEGTYAYHIPFRNYRQLSFGLSTLMYQFKIDDFANPNDGVDNIDPLLYGLQSFVVDFSVGAYYTDKDYYGGISIKNISGSALSFGSSTWEASEIGQHIYLSGGYRFYLPADFELIPSAQFTFSNNLRTQYDLSAKAVYRKDYWAGLTFRPSFSDDRALSKPTNIIVAFMGLKFDKYYLGYSIDFSFGDIHQYQYGSHEFVFAIKFGDNARRYRWTQRY